MIQLDSPSRGRYQRNTLNMGLTIALTSWTLIFLTLLWGYIFYRTKSVSWLKDYIDPQIQWLAIVNTVIIVLSSLSLRIYMKKMQRPILLWVTIALGIVFLLGQIQLWNLVMGHGLDWRQSIAGSFFFLMTGFHGAHILGALLAMVIVALSRNVRERASFSTAVQCFWDLLLFLWFVLFVLIFILQ